MEPTIKPKFKSAIEWIEPRKKTPAKWKAKLLTHKGYDDNDKKLTGQYVRLTKTINRRNIVVTVDVKENEIQVSHPGGWGNNEYTFSLEQWKDLNDAVVEARDYLALLGV